MGLDILGLDILGLDILRIICFMWVWIVLKVWNGYIVFYQKQPLAVVLTGIMVQLFERYNDWVWGSDLLTGKGSIDCK